MFTFILSFSSSVENKNNKNKRNHDSNNNDSGNTNTLNVWSKKIEGFTTLNANVREKNVIEWFINDMEDAKTVVIMQSFKLLNFSIQWFCGFKC